MAKRLDELTNQLDDGDIALRFKKSEQFFAGSNEVDLGGKGSFSVWFARILALVGLLSLIGIAGAIFYIWMWDSSPLTETVDAQVTGIEKKSQGGIVSFQYEVGDQTYQVKQLANSTKAQWREENATAEIVYLKFLPGTAKLKSTIERMDWMMLFLGPLMPLGFLIGGLLGLRSAKRLSRIEDNATHILNGTVCKRVPVKGLVIVQYQTTSPASGEEIFGGVEVGKLESALGGLQVGARVAVIYANDKEHTLL